MYMYNKAGTVFLYAIL